MNGQFSGVGVALITPFNEEGNVDYDALHRLLIHDEKADMFVIAGTTGEAAVLTPEEKNAIVSFVKKHNDRKKKLVLGIGGNNTQKVIEEIQRTDFEGVDGILSVSPYYVKPSQAGIIGHFEAVADASPVPVILYNVPGRTGSNMTWKTTVKLAQHPNIRAIKEASGDLSQCIRITKHKPAEFELISGDDLLTLPILAVGGTGVISVLANPYPEIFRNIIDGVATGNLNLARESQYAIADINGLMYEGGSPVGVKVVLSAMGICHENVRPPHAAASDNLKNEIKKLML